MNIVITERGWAGHFCLADQCLFRRNTLIECGEKRVVVSTVGNCHPHSMKGKLHYIGWDKAVYETLVFQAQLVGKYWEADIMEELDGVRLRESQIESGKDDLMANEMHEKMVQKFAREMRQG